MGKRLFYWLNSLVSPLFSLRAFRVYCLPSSLFFSGTVMLRKYGWLVVFALFMFLFEGLLMQWIELISTESDKCRNMNSVNPLKLVNCADLN